MAQTLGQDEATQAGRRMAERMAAASAWLTEWGLTTSDLVLANPQRGIAVGPQKGEPSAEDVLGVVEDHYLRPDMEVSILNAHRVHAARQTLLDSGAFTVKQLAAAHGRPVNTVHKLIQRAGKRGEVLAVTVNGETHIPAVLLDEALEFRAHWQPVISVLQDAGMTGWGIWRWIAEPNAGLSGEIAAELIESSPERVYAAARRRVIQIAA